MFVIIIVIFDVVVIIIISIDMFNIVTKIIFIRVIINITIIISTNIIIQVVAIAVAVLLHTSCHAEISSSDRLSSFSSALWSLGLTSKRKPNE
jgi:hypothetical protein